MRLEKKGDKITGKAAIFKAGNYGERGTYTRDDLSAIANNPNSIGVPIGPGHDVFAFDGLPRGGQVTALQVHGDLLFAEMEFEEPFANLVGNNMYTEVSAAIAPSRRLAHVAFLGMQAPAIKGLLKEYVPFSSGKNDDLAVFFSSPGKADRKENTEDNKMDEKTVSALTDAAATKAAAQVREEMTAKFSASEAAWNEEKKALTEAKTVAEANIKKIEAELAQFKAETAKNTVMEDVKQIVATGAIPPESAADYANQMLALFSSSPDVYRMTVGLMKRNAAISASAPNPANMLQFSPNDFVANQHAAAPIAHFSYSGGGYGGSTNAICDPAAMINYNGAKK